MVSWPYAGARWPYASGGPEGIYFSISHVERQGTT
jgi:hypothetical protein